MGLPERVPDEAKEPEQPGGLLDESKLFTGKALPTREVELELADGTAGKVLIQALSMQEMDEINHIQNQAVRDAKGNVIEEATRIGFEAKIVARALRHPNKTRMAVQHWQALAEKISGQWLAGSTKKVAGVVLDLSGYTQLARSEEKKG